MKNAERDFELVTEVLSYNNKQLLALYWLSQECDKEWRAALEEEILGRMSLQAHRDLARHLRVLAGIFTAITVALTVVALVTAYVSYSALTSITGGTVS